MYLKHGAYYYDHPADHRLIRLGRTIEDVRVMLPRIGADGGLFEEKHLGVMYLHAKKNARAREIAFALSREDVVALWKRSGGRCELTRIKFDTLNLRGYRRRPWVASIDRIDSAEGYSARNCRLVCVAINLAMNEWGEEVFARMVSSYKRSKYQADIKISGK